MERMQRIARINMLVRRRQGVTMEQLLEDMEVSRATINRDLQYMRDQMHAPIVWDRHNYCYRIGQDEDTRYMLPGLWLTPAQAYAYLTLQNMVEKIAPNLLGPFLEPMRISLKEMLSDAQFLLYGLDKKVEIAMSKMPSLGDLDFNNLMEALLNDQQIVLEFTDDLNQAKALTGVPVKLRITSKKWRLGLKSQQDDEIQWFNIDQIKRVRLIDEATV